MDYNKTAEIFLTTVIKRGKAEMMQRFNGYSKGEQLVLGYLYNRLGHPIVPSEIAKLTRTSTARVTIILNNLESKGLITREISTADRRKILVVITENGQLEAEKVKVEACANVARIFEEMGKKRSESFIENFNLFLDIGIRQGQELKEKKDGHNASNK